MIFQLIECWLLGYENRNRSVYLYDYQWVSVLQVLFKKGKGAINDA